MCIICNQEYKNQENITSINCSGCTSVTKIPVIEGLKYLWCKGCEWVNQNPKYNENIRKLIILQMFCRKNISYFRFNKWIRTRYFSEWFYYPDNMGEYKHKKNIDIINKCRLQISTILANDLTHNVLNQTPLHVFFRVLRVF
jgi:hypothetical protein